jgi:hypothetical protein
VHSTVKTREGVGRARIRVATATAIVVAVALLSVASAASASSWLAHKLMQRGGGTLRAANGAAIYVPRNTMRRPGWVTIGKVGRGDFNFHIWTRWSGRVRVTLPAPPRGDVAIVLHQINGDETVASSSLGQLTVWTDHLSNFEDSIPEACLEPEIIADPEAFGACLAGWGVGRVVGLGLTELAGLILQGGGSQSPGGTSTGTGSLPVGQGAPVTIQGGSPTLQGSNPTPTPTPSPTPTPPPTPAPTSTPAPSPTVGFVIDDSVYGGTWARTDPNSGTWYAHSSPPPNASYWYPNGLGVAVSCAEPAASYNVIINGQHQTWNWWAHVTDGKWVPTVVFSSVWANGLPASLSQC